MEIHFLYQMERLQSAILMEAILAVVPVGGAMPITQNIAPAMGVQIQEF